jgi:hypothetical protein
MATRQRKLRAADHQLGVGIAHGQRRQIRLTRRVEAGNVDRRLQERRQVGGQRRARETEWAEAFAGQRAFQFQLDMALENTGAERFQRQLQPVIRPAIRA